MHHALKSLPGEQLLHGLAVRDIEFREAKRRIAQQNLEARPFQLRVVVRVEVVEPDHFVAALEQQPRGMETDETGRAGHEHFHNRRHTVLPDDALSRSARICSCAEVSSSVAATTTMGM